ncbi:MAG: GTP-binding protein, partial [Planctomycetota bacterium]|nr:GTP-binding protein [Planctomycetota bacterium]
MAAKSPDKIRNIAFVGHSTCGKSSLVESLLFTGGGIDRKGSVDDGTSVCDYDDQERERNHSIDLACASVETADTLLQFIDTPGYRDFIGQVYCSTAGTDLMAIVICCDEGIRPNTRKVWEIARDANLPCFVV